MAGQAASATDSDLWYEVDARNHITAVSPGWDALALASGGEQATSATVIGRPLAASIAGDITRMYLETAIQAVRVSGTGRVLPYRCDTPDLQRWFEMRLTALPQGAVRVLHTQVAARRRIGKRHEKPARPVFLRTCSMCLRDTMTGDWTDAVDDPDPEAPHVYGICPDCDARARRFG